MPIYEFECKTCGKQVEKLMKLSDPVPKCDIPDCGLTKKISAASFELKGTGWYATDFKIK